MTDTAQTEQPAAEPDTAGPAKARGIDYAFFPHPALGELGPGGIRFVVRYTSPSASNDRNGKNLLAGELRGLLAAGLEIAVVFESGAGRMLGGFAAGKADAQHLDAVVAALGMHGLPGYFACDIDAQPHDMPVIGAYLAGGAAEIGLHRTGLYGGYPVISYAFDHHLIGYGWQTYAWSGTPTRWDSRAHLRQVRNGVTISGASCDLDDAMAADFGQWPRPATHKGPYRHVVPHGNRLSLDKAARARDTTVDRLTKVSQPELNAEHLAVFNAYLTLRAALRKAGLRPPAMPGGMIYYTSKP